MNSDRPNFVPEGTTPEDAKKMIDKDIQQVMEEPSEQDIKEAKDAKDALLKMTVTEVNESEFDEDEGCECCELPEMGKSEFPPLDMVAGYNIAQMIDAFKVAVGDLSEKIVKRITPEELSGDHMLLVSKQLYDEDLEHVYDARTHIIENCIRPAVVVLGKEIAAMKTIRYCPIPENHHLSGALQFVCDAVPCFRITIEYSPAMSTGKPLLDEDGEPRFDEETGEPLLEYKSGQQIHVDTFVNPE